MLNWPISLDWISGCKFWRCIPILLPLDSILKVIDWKQRLKSTILIVSKVLWNSHFCILNSDTYYTLLSFFHVSVSLCLFLAALLEALCLWPGLFRMSQNNNVGYFLNIRIPLKKGTLFSVLPSDHCHYSLDYGLIPSYCSTKLIPAITVLLKWFHPDFLFSTAAGTRFLKVRGN